MTVICEPHDDVLTMEQCDKNIEWREAGLQTAQQTAQADRET